MIETEIVHLDYPLERSNNPEEDAKLMKGYSRKVHKALMDFMWGKQITRQDIISINFLDATCFIIIYTKS